MHPPRIAGFSYEGLHRYLLTFTTFRRLRLFADRVVANHILEQFRTCASRERFEILAYCLMPDHAHLLVAGLAECSSLRRFVSTAKQQSGYWFARTESRRLWQTGFYDHVLRDDDATIAVVRYILANPTRAGITTEIGEYALAGSDAFSMNEIRECLQMWTGRQG